MWYQHYLFQLLQMEMSLIMVILHELKLLQVAKWHTPSLQSVDIWWLSIWLHFHVYDWIWAESWWSDCLSELRHSDKFHLSLVGDSSSLFIILGWQFIKNDVNCGSCGTWRYGWNVGMGEGEKRNGNIFTWFDWKWKEMVGRKKVINILPLSLAFYDPPKCME